MPANLNALIRYKTINSCLYGGKRKWSINELKEKCSEALAEYRGRYEPISERTLRDDIRVMRSDILGYNAPIEQQKGLYYYSDPEYSIMTLSFTDSALIERIIMFLGEIKTKVSHPELEIILNKLEKMRTEHILTGEELEDTQLLKESAAFSHDQIKEEAPARLKKLLKVHASRRRTYMADETAMPMAPAPSGIGIKDQLNWGSVMNAIFSN